MRLIYILLLNFFLLFNYSLQAQSLPITEEFFFQRFTIVNQMPERILSGRTLLFYSSSLTQKELERIQESFSTTGIDAVLAIAIEKLLGGHDVRKALFEAIQKREISNLVFVQKDQQEYRCTMTKFNQKFSFVNTLQPAWQLSKSALGELLLELGRDAQNALSKQNFLVNDQPETDLKISIIRGSRIESHSSDLRVDRLAVRLSDRVEDNEALKNELSSYPFKLEFVGDSISDAELRLKGFWYVLQSVHLPEKQALEILGYTLVKRPIKIVDEKSVYKFYFKKLEFDNVYLGKEWDAAANWQDALKNTLANLRKELNVR
ncbi:hypothetical protein SanaruYs_11560 [Chryseotalea sanaruensis]|uniref:Uncharacterized protein n=1 Tax=Chryseotalea sanaruensis TaxID=2482724 RepID=A0A401U7T0_9BACT|nr:hypothetical protein [Chryseotalea sanaruensis]GCC50937.1 hypothetical protein SanaruYs_11560 [Chryseotalea sanaruensis]